MDLHVIFLAETDPVLRQWQVYKEEIQFSYEVLPSWRKRVGRYNVLLNRGVGRALGSGCAGCDPMRRVQLCRFLAGAVVGADSEHSVSSLVGK